MLRGEHRLLALVVDPSELVFYVHSNSADKHKKTLTIINPYDFPVKFDISSNSRDRYSVLPPRGEIREKYFADLAVRHKEPIPSNVNASDRFRVTINDPTTNEILGKRYIDVKLLLNDSQQPSQDDDTISGKYYKLYEHESAKHKKDDDYVEIVRNLRNRDLRVLLLVGAFLVGALFLPTQPEPVVESSLPEYLHLNYRVKAIIAFLLGILTMAFVFPSR